MRPSLAMKSKQNGDRAPKRFVGQNEDVCDYIPGGFCSCENLTSKADNLMRMQKRLTISGAEGLVPPMAVSLSMGLEPIAAVMVVSEAEERRRKPPKQPAREAGDGSWGVEEEESCRVSGRNRSNYSWRQLVCARLQIAELLQLSKLHFHPISLLFLLFTIVQML